MKIYLQKSVYNRLQNYRSGISFGNDWWRKCKYSEFPNNIFCIEAILTALDFYNTPLSGPMDDHKDIFYPDRLTEIGEFVERMKVLQIPQNNNQRTWGLQDFVTDSKNKIYMRKKKKRIESSDIVFIYYKENMSEVNPYSKFVLGSHLGDRKRASIGESFTQTYKGIPSPDQIKYLNKKALTKKDKAKRYFHKKYWKFENEILKTFPKLTKNARKTRGIKRRPIEMRTLGKLIIPEVDKKFGKYTYTAFGYQIFVDEEGRHHAFYPGKHIYTFKNVNALQFNLTF